MKDRISFNPTELFKTTYIGHLDALITMGSEMNVNTLISDMRGLRFFVKTTYQIPSSYPICGVSAN